MARRTINGKQRKGWNSVSQSMRERLTKYRRHFMRLLAPMSISRMDPWRYIVDSLYRANRTIRTRRPAVPASRSSRTQRNPLALEPLERRCLLAALFPEFLDPNPGVGNQFGASVVTLTNGNVVITSPFDDTAATDAGAVYLFNGATGSLIDTVLGSSSGDRIGSGGVTALSNGNFVISSPSWRNATSGASAAGAATFGLGTSGVSGSTVSSANSLVGTSSGDLVGSGGITALSNGNYVVSTPLFSGGDVGAATWGSGSSGVNGVINSVNSLTGSNSGDRVSSGGITALTNGNYVVSSPGWRNPSTGAISAGAATFGNGTSGTDGLINTGNSLIGSQPDDRVSSGGITALPGGLYVVSSPDWNHGSIIDAGAASYIPSVGGITGVVATSNSLYGTRASDRVGSGGISAVTGTWSGHFVVASPTWDNSTITTDAGAVTFVNGSAPAGAAVSSGNSLFGTSVGDRIGSGGVIALAAAKYVVLSPEWTGTRGAVTLRSPLTGTTGSVNTGNSLTGSAIGNRVGSGGIEELSSGHYVVWSPEWDNGGAIDAGAVTFVSSSGFGLIAPVSTGNSLFGTSPGDRVGSGGVTALTNGKYVVASPDWAGTRGAATLGGASGIAGSVSSGNSLFGNIPGDRISSGGITSLVGGAGNYIVSSPSWDNSGIVDAGAATFGNGSSGVVGPISSFNSLVGSSGNDNVGSGGVTALSTGRYAVASPNWDNQGIVTNAGAVTFGVSTGVFGAINTSNSTVGMSANTNLQGVVVDNTLSHLHFFARFTNEPIGGRVRVGSQIDGFGTPNSAPTVTRDMPAVTAVEGGIATNSGTFFDADGMASVLLTANIGVVTQNNSTGTWDWTLNAVDGPAGPVTVIIRAEDNQLAFATAEFTYSISNDPPTISLSGDATVNEGSPYTLNLGAIHDPGNDLISGYRIEWGDGHVDIFSGSPANTVAVHTFADGPANHTQTIRITDEDGTFVAGVLSVQILNVAPTIALTGNSSVAEGSLYTLNLGAITEPGADSVTAWRINWGDGEFSDFAGNPQNTLATHTYADGTNTHHISVSLTDEDGVHNAAGNWFVTVDNVDPLVEISGNTTVNEGSVYTLNLATSDPGDDSISSWFIDWGDGSDPDNDNSIGEIIAGNPSSATHVYIDGTRSYTILAAATDEDGTYDAAASGSNAIVSVDPTFGEGGEVLEDFFGSSSDQVRQLVLRQADGKILVAGTATGGTPNIGLARYNPDGTPDIDFGIGGKTLTDFGAQEDVQAMAVDSQGRILVGGNFGLARYSVDGALDTSFGVGGKLTLVTGIVDLAIDSQDRIVVTRGNSLSRISSNGTVDQSFNGGSQIPLDASFYGWRVTIASGNAVVVGGYYYVGLNYDFRAVRYTSGGQLDTTFGVGGSDGDGRVTIDYGGRQDYVYDVAMHGDGILLLGYTAPIYNSSLNQYQDPSGNNRLDGDLALVRLRADGTLDTNFAISSIAGPGQAQTHLSGWDHGYTLYVTASQQILAGGSSFWTRYSASGDLDTSINPTSSFPGRAVSYVSTVWGIVEGANGAVLTGGSRFVSGGQGSNFAVARHLANGTLDQNFGVGGPDGNGIVTTDFEGSTADYVRELVLTQPDGKVLVAGYKSGGIQELVLIRYLADGSRDPGFGSGGVVIDGTISSPEGLVVDSQGRLVVLANNYLARYNADGSADNSFGSSPGSNRVYLGSQLSYSYDLELDANEDLVVGGYRSRQSTDVTVTSNDLAVARYHGHSGAGYSAGDVDISFGTSGVTYLDLNSGNYQESHEYVNDIELDSAGRILAVGYSYRIDRGVQQYLRHNDFMVARFLGNGELDTSFGTGTSTNNSGTTVIEGLDGIVLTDFGGGENAQSAALDSQGRIVAGGGSYLARYLDDGTLDNSFSGDGKLTGAYASSIAIDGEDRIVSVNSNYLQRTLSDGTPDLSFAPSGRLIVPNRIFNQVAMDQSGRIVVAGQTSSSGFTGIDFLTSRYLTVGLSVNVLNVVPQSVTLTAPGTANEGATVNLSGSASDPAGAFDPLTYTWTITRNSVPFLQTTGNSVSLTLPDSGSYFVVMSVDDGDGGVVTRTTTITVNNVAPTISVDTTAVTIDEGTSTSKSITTSDVPADTVSVTASIGTMTDNGNGSWTWSYDGTDDLTVTSVTLTAGDEDGGLTSVSFDLTVNNVGPTAIDDAASINEDASAISISVRNNDTDPATTFDPLTISGVDSTGTVGTVTFNGTQVTYDPNGQFEHLAVGETATDTFSYTISDGDGGTATATVAITIVGQNDAPVVNLGIANQTASEDALFSFGVPSDAFDDVDVGDSLTYSASGLPAWLSFDGTTFSGTPANGDVGTVTITVQADDGNGGPIASTSFDLTVLNTNDPATIGGDNIGAMNENGLGDSGIMVVSDPDAGQSQFTAGATAGLYGTFSINAAGSWSYTRTANLDHLNAGDIVTDNFTVQSLDGTASEVVTITITGLNDAATIAGTSSGTTDEDSTSPVSGVLTVSDVDQGQNQAVPQTGSVGSYGTFSIDASGNWSYLVNSASVQYLPAGQQVSESFTVVSQDGTASQLVTITIEGRNDLASITGDDAGLADEDSASAVTGALVISDVDQGENTAVSQSGTSGSYGSFSIDANGNWNYVVNNAAVQYLPAGQQVNDSFTVTSTDGTASQLVTIMIEGRNDAASITGDDAGLTNEDSTTSVAGVLVVLDVDQGENVTVAQAGTAGSYGSFSVDASGNWSYAVNNAAVQYLPAGQQVSDTFTVVSLDGTASQLVTITIEGRNDDATISGTASGSTDEDTATPVSGVLSVSDVDQGENQAIAQTATAGSYGTFSIDASGNWTYTVDNAAVQYLPAGQQVSDSFTVVSQDGTANQLVTITINGRNDAATISGTASGSTDEDTANPVNGNLEVVDVDANENRVQSQSGTAGSYGTFSIDSAGNWTYIVNNASVQFLQAGQQATDSFTVRSHDGTASQLVTITIDGRNDSTSTTISGTVFIDVDGDGLFDGGTESSLDGVIIELFDSNGNLVDTDETEMGGVYAFVVDDGFGTYRIRQTQPSGVGSLAAVPGNLGGTVISSNEMTVTLNGNEAFDYDFTEQGQAVQAGDAATIGFWQNKNGQALIRTGGTALASWLAANFGNVFGNTFTDGANGDNGDEVASFYKNEFFKKKLTGTAKVDAQFMATALATWFTSSHLAGTNVAAGYGFNVTEQGLGARVVNVGNNGAAFSVANNTNMTVMALLLATNNLTGSSSNGSYRNVYDLNGDGVLDSAELALRAMANSVYSSINESGDIE